MATYNKFQPFVEDLCEAGFNLGTDQLVVALCSSTNTPASTVRALASLTTITYTNLSSRNITTSASAQTGGTYQLSLTDLTLTASGAVNTFRYVVVYDDTPTSPADPVIAFYDHGSNVTLASNETFTIDFSTTGFFQLS